MGQGSFRNPYGPPEPGGAGAFALAPDHFRDKAIRKAAAAAMPRQPKLKPAEARLEPAPMPAAVLPPGPKPVEAEFVAEAPVTQRPVSEKKGPLFAGFNLKPRLAAILPA